MRSAAKLDFQAKIAGLVKRAWGSREENAAAELILRPSSLVGLTLDDIVRELLVHVRRVSPALSVPMASPKVTIDPIPDAAGQFIVQDGWVRVSVSGQFLLDLPATQAILCHELCHYVLEANGIRETTIVENERLTEVAMFVFGLGDIFLAGYRRRGGEYRPGHRLGYLTGAEYRSVASMVSELRFTGRAQQTGLAEAEKLLKARISDAGARKRLFENARKRHPAMSETEVIRLIIDQYERDRR